MKRFVKIISQISLFFLLLVLLFVCYVKYVKKEPIVKLAGYAVLVVLTDSMEPTIEGNELVLIKENEKYQLNDIVTYRDYDNVLITHRIVEIDNYHFVAKGDGNDVSDEKKNLQNIEGKVIFHSKIGGVFVLYYLKFLIFVYVIIVLAIYWIKSVVKGKSDEKKKI